MSINTLVIVLAFGVLVAVAILLAREASRARRPGPGANPSPLPPERKAVEGAAEELEETRFGGRLPSLRDGTPEAADAASASKALTLFERGAELDEPTASRRLVLVHAAGATHLGLRRSRNEDAIALDTGDSVFVVADGMGGYAGGDVASRLAVDAITGALARGAAGIAAAGRPRSASALVSAIEEANRRIWQESNREPKWEGMGATVVTVRFYEKKQRAVIGHVGDSRCYRMRGGVLTALTQDHTLAAAGVPGAMGSHVRRALGVKPSVTVDVCVDKPLAGDVYLLCSDGLNKMVSDESIAGIIGAGRDDLSACVESLIAAANGRGGRDNISVILVGVAEGERAAA